MKKHVVLFLLLVLISLLVSISKFSSFASSSYEWPMFLHDEKNSCFTLGMAPDSNRILWQVSGYAGYQTAPIVVNGCVYVGGTDGGVYSLDALTGAFKWKYQTGAHESQTPKISSGNGLIIVGSYPDRTVYALKPDNGELVWTFHTLGVIACCPPTYNDITYVTCQAGFVYALDPDDGHEIWRRNIGGMISSNPAISDGKVIVGTWGGPIYALDAYNGNPLWTFSAGIVTATSIFENKVIFKATTGIIYALDITDGHKIWQSDATWGEGGEAAIAYGKVFFMWGGSGDAWALNLDNGQTIWHRHFGPASGTHAHCGAVADNKLFCVAGNSLYCLDTSNGAEIWSYDTGASISTAPAVAYGTVFIGSGNTIYAFGEESIPEIQAKIDLKPEILNLKSKGKWISCYIELPEEYDVINIDISSVKLMHEDNLICSAKLHPTKIEDYDKDGIPDLMVKFDRKTLINYLKDGSIKGKAELTVAGEIDGIMFSGSDIIKVISKGQRL